MLVGCADSSTPQQRENNTLTAATGAVAFSINWAPDPASGIASRFVCGPGGDQVAFVDARLENQNHTIVLDTPWSCDTGRGIIAQVPADTDYSLRISAFSA